MCRIILFAMNYIFYLKLYFLYLSYTSYSLFFNECYEVTIDPIKIG